MLYVLDYNDGTPLNFLFGADTPQEEDVMQLVHKAAGENGMPKKIRIPAIVPFTSRPLQKWCWENKAAIYNLSMAKPENILEANYINDDIAKQLEIDESITSDALQRAAENWMQSFARTNREAINYFAKEPIV